MRCLLMKRKIKFKVHSELRTKTSQFIALLNWICVRFNMKERKGEERQNGSREIERTTGRTAGE